MSVLTRLEIDVLVAGELDESARLAVKYHLPGLVIHPGLASEGHIARGRIRGQYKIIIPIDWPKGDIFGSSKMRGLSTDALEADGFEILLTPGKSEIDTRNEAKVITEFIRNHLGRFVEIRFVMGTLTRTADEIKTQSMGLKGIPIPAFVRNDINLKAQVSKANPDIHNASIETILAEIKVPIKIAGNINDLKAIASCKGVAAFGVSLLQAKQIIKEFNSHPEKLKELLVNTDYVPDLKELLVNMDHVPDLKESLVDTDHVPDLQESD